MRSMKFIQNYHNEHTKIEFGMLIVVIFHTLHFAVWIAAMHKHLVPPESYWIVSAKLHCNVGC